MFSLSLEAVNVSMKREYSHTNADPSLSLRQQTFKLLDKNHILSPLNLCKLLSLDHVQHGATIRQYRAAWKREYKKRQALNSLSFHRARGWIRALKMESFRFGAEGSRERAVMIQAGWRAARNSRNGMVYFVDKFLGRLEWFGSTGRINVWLKKPATKGKLKQLLANGFLKTERIKDVDVFDLWANSARFKGAHVTLDLGEKLPYGKIDFLKDSLGVVAKTGDLSHPTCLELEYCYPDWMEKNERLLELSKEAIKLNSEQIQQFTSMMREFSNPKGLKRSEAQDHNMIF